MTGYSPVSIPKKNNGGRTKPKKAKIIIFRLNDVETFPDVDDKGISIDSDLVLNEKAKAFYLEATASTINITQTSEGDPDNKGCKQKIELSRPGSDDLPFEEFIENNINEDLGAIVEYQGTNICKLAGYPGNPLQISVESTDNNEGDVNKLTLESVLRGRRISFYKGKLPALADTAITDPPATSGSSSGQSV